MTTKSAGSALERREAAPWLRGPGSQWLRRVCTMAQAKPLGALGGLLILLLVGMAIFAPLLAPYDPIHIKAADRLRPPSPMYVLGTDDFGRDILSRIIYGARISMVIGLGAVGISTVLATLHDLAHAMVLSPYLSLGIVDSLVLLM